MLALYLGGRTGDALEHYRRARAGLAAELGVDPGAALQKLHQQILRADAELTAPRVARHSPARLPVARELPADLRWFVGRRDELSRLDGILAAGDDDVVIVGLSGTAGVGKTTLALHWAHQVARRFPDGQLYVNLRGFDGATALGTSVVLRRFIGALGVPAGQIPSGVDARAALFRSLLADKRVLVVLDNARDAEHVQPLFPGTAGSMVNRYQPHHPRRSGRHGGRPPPGPRCAQYGGIRQGSAGGRIGSDVVAAQPGPVDESVITRCAQSPAGAGDRIGPDVGRPGPTRGGAARVRRHIGRVPPPGDDRRDRPVVVVPGSGASPRRGCSGWSAATRGLT